MKKNNVFPLLILLLISVSLNIYLTKTDIVIDDTVSKIVSEKVINYLDIDFFLDKPLDFNDYYLLFDEIKLTSNNFISMFSSLPLKEIDIKKIYPYISPRYENSLNKYIGVINFDSSDIKKGLNDAFNKYLNALNNYGLDDEINKINVHGLRIRMVLINAQNKMMYDFLNNHPKIKFSFKLEGPYYKIK